MATYTTNFNLKKPALNDPVDVGDINGNMDLIDAAMTAILNKLYPVGSIYMSANSTNPGDIFGGTWTQITGRFLLGAGGTYVSGAEGGEATHTLIESELPSISGSFNIRNIGPDSSPWRVLYSTTGKFQEEPVSDTANGIQYSDARPTMQKVTFEFGGDQPHNIMPPYHVVYIWKRVA